MTRGYSANETEEFEEYLRIANRRQKIERSILFLISLISIIIFFYILRKDYQRKADAKALNNSIEICQEIQRQYENLLAQYPTTTIYNDCPIKPNLE